jgi:hypothetical protein
VGLLRASPESSGAGCCRQPSDSVLPFRRSATPSIWPLRMTLVKLQPASCRSQSDVLSRSRHEPRFAMCIDILTEEKMIANASGLFAQGSIDSRALPAACAHRGQLRVFAQEGKLAVHWQEVLWPDEPQHLLQLVPAPESSCLSTCHLKHTATSGCTDSDFHCGVHIGLMGAPCARLSAAQRNTNSMMSSGVR